MHGNGVVDSDTDAVATKPVKHGIPVGDLHHQEMVDVPGAFIDAEQAHGVDVVEHCAIAIGGSVALRLPVIQVPELDRQKRRLKAVESTPKGTRVTMETAIHVVGSDRPALVYDGITLYQAPRG